MLRKEIKYTICVFANTLGGKILVGVTDSGKTIGVEYNNSILAQVQHFAREINPNLKILVNVCPELKVIVIEVFKSDELHNVNGMFFIREGSMTVKLIEPDEIRNLFELKSKLSFDDRINNEFDIKKDFDDENYKRFIEKSDISNLSEEHVLNNIGAMVNHKLLNAGVLFFCNKVTKFFKRADIVCVLWKGIQKVDIIDKSEFNQDFISNYEGAFNYIVSKLNMNIIIKPMGRDEKLELPEEALREALINAMVHRNYLSNGRIQVDIFYDRVEISNPGALLFDEEELGETSLARNSLIVDLVFRLNLVEKIGSGISRIKKLCSENNTSVKFKISSDWFTVVFERKIEGSATIEKTHLDRLGDRLGDNQLKIVYFMSQNKTISIPELSTAIGISTTAIEKHIKGLKDKGIIKRIGSAKGGYWEVMD